MKNRPEGAKVANILKPILSCFSNPPIASRTAATNKFSYFWVYKDKEYGGVPYPEIILVFAPFAFKACPLPYGFPEGGYLFLRFLVGLISLCHAYSLLSTQINALTVGQPQKID
jgi:hypothetical protein